MKWIKCSRKLPPVNLRVLACDEKGWVFTASYVFYDPGYIWEHSAGEEPGCEVICWQPLPEPPKDEE